MMNSFYSCRPAPSPAVNNAAGADDTPMGRLTAIILGAFVVLVSAAVPRPAAAQVAAPTVKFGANPATVSSGGATTLTWSTTNASSCSASNAWSGSVATGGSSSTGAITSAETYTLTCQGAGGTTSATRKVYLTSEVPQITFTANPKSVQAGGYSTLTWSVLNTDNCHSYGAWHASEPAQGSATTNGLTATSSFDLVCWNVSGASSSAWVTVTVAGSGAGSGTVTLGWSPPTLNTNGTPVTPLQGYTVYYGTSAASMTQSLAVAGGSANSCEITGLAAGTWYFGVAANATDGTNSATSAVGSLAI
jgi:hypothetical protein